MKVNKVPLSVAERFVRPKSYASLKTTGNIVKMYACTGNMPDAQEGVIKKISRDYYEDLRTGELKEYNHSAENRMDNLQSVRKSMIKIRDTINCNLLDPQKALWCTLTYKENMCDNVRLRVDFNKFCKRFDYHCIKMGWGKPLHIAVPEPQGRGAWHIHCLFWWPDLEAAPYVPSSCAAFEKSYNLPVGSKPLETIWGFGFVSVKKLQNCDNVGAYLTAYLTDLPLDDYSGGLDGLEVVEKEISDVKSCVRKKKKFIKGARLGLYPVGMKLLWASQGLSHPTLERMTYEEALQKEKVSCGEETFSSGYALDDDNGVTVRTAVIRQYNTSRLSYQGADFGSFAELPQSLWVPWDF